MKKEYKIYRPLVDKHYGGVRRTVRSPKFDTLCKETSIGDVIDIERLGRVVVTRIDRTGVYAVKED